MATAAAQAGDPDRAEALARTITSPKYQVRALTEMAQAVAEAGDADRADRLAIDAEAMARTITEPDDQAQALARLATVAAGADDPDGTDRPSPRPVTWTGPGTYSRWRSARTHRRSSGG